MRPPLNHIIKDRMNVFEPPRKDHGSTTEQDFRRLCTADLAKIYRANGPRLDRLAARTILLERGYNLPDPFVPGITIPDELPLLQAHKHSTTTEKH